MKIITNPVFRNDPNFNNLSFLPRGAMIRRIGDGTFTADVETFHRRAEMGDKLPPGV